MASQHSFAGSVRSARNMRCWVFFHRELTDDQPEVWEIRRFQQVATEMGIVLEVLKPRKFDLIVDPHKGWSATYEGRELTRPDFIMSRIGSETSYFTLAVLRHFEHLGVTMMNSPTAIEKVADKLHTSQILSASGLPTPRTILGKFPVDIEVVAREIGFPVVVKRLTGTRGEGVLLCDSREQFADLAALLDGGDANANFIFQEFIKESHGRDLRVLVIMGRAVAAMERQAANGNFKSNISLGGRALPYKLHADVAHLAENAADAVGLDVAGVDILFAGDDYRICEVNSAPGFQGLEAATQINVPRLIFSSMQRRRRRLFPSWARRMGRLLRKADF